MAVRATARRQEQELVDGRSARGREALLSEEPEKKRRRRRRRRRRDDPDRAGFAALLPQLLTTGNLASGFYAIVMASSGNVLVASYAIFVAALFDILDGRAARMTGNVSRFGAEYDSIADTVSFGVAPAISAFTPETSRAWAGPAGCWLSRTRRVRAFGSRASTCSRGASKAASTGFDAGGRRQRSFLDGVVQELSGRARRQPGAAGGHSRGRRGVPPPDGQPDPVPQREEPPLRAKLFDDGDLADRASAPDPGAGTQLLPRRRGLRISGPAGHLWRWRTGRELDPAEEKDCPASPLPTPGTSPPSRIMRPSTDAEPSPRSQKQSPLE